MSDSEKEKLVETVVAFVKAQPDYNAEDHDKLKVFCENENTWSIAYGEHITNGITGFGETPDLAFRDFVNNWYHFKGFEWIKLNI